LCCLILGPEFYSIHPSVYSWISAHCDYYRLTVKLAVEYEQTFHLFILYSIQIFLYKLENQFVSNFTIT
jgi:hypothetical protein